MDIYPNWPNEGKPQAENKEEPKPKNGMDISSLLPLLMQMNGGQQGMNPEMLKTLMSSGGSSNPMMGAMLASMMGNIGGNKPPEQKRSFQTETPFPNSVKVDDYYRKSNK